MIGMEARLLVADAEVQGLDMERLERVLSEHKTLIRDTLILISRIKRAIVALDAGDVVAAKEELCMK